MDKVVELKNIYSLKDFINCGYVRDKISEFYQKKTYSSKLNEYKPGSEKWLKVKERDEEISKIPDHNVKDNYEDLIIEYGHKKVEFSIGTITIKRSGYCSETDEFVEGDVTLNFLVENSYWGYGLICSFDELILHDQIQSLFEEMLDDQIRGEWRKRLESIEDGAFMLLLDKIVKSEKNLIKCDIWSSYNRDDMWCQIGEEKYHLKDMLVINKAFDNNDYEFYDENDRRIKYEWYSNESFPDFYLKHSKINLAN
jgi:hypothetical protein